MKNTKQKPIIPLLCADRHLYSFGQNKTVRNNQTARLLTPWEAVRMAKKIIIDPHKEHFITIYLCPTRKQPKCELISLGTLTASLVHPREVFRPAIKYNATEIIILHNHPSSDVSPSEADITLTERLKNAGQLLGIEVLDHVIFEKGDRFYSFENNK
jgi:DNA repair protein RadC